MKLENNLYSNFKPYTYYTNNQETTKINKSKKINKKIILGAALGVGTALTISKYGYKHNFFKEMPDEIASNATKKIKYTVKDVASMLTMAGLADVGAVVINSKNDNKETKNKKWHEAAFQMMNTSIPMLFVTGVNILSDNVKKLNNKPFKIIASLAAMIGGAVTATKITNINKSKEDKRKYTIKDSVANFDDVVATIVVGFPQYQKLNTVSKCLLPFIYTYCGSRVSEQ